MRAVIVIAMLLLILGLFGWIQFHSSDGDPTIRVDTDKVKQDTNQIVEKSKQLIDRTAEKVDASIDDASTDRELSEPAPSEPVAE